MKRFDQINMIPFIDIMLVLLAIVLTTASFVTQGLIDVNLPKAGVVSEKPNEKKFVEITIDKENIIYFEEQKLDIRQLEAQLLTLPKSQMFVLRIDKAAIFEHFIELIDLLKSKQFRNLSIQAEKKVVK